MRGMTAFKGWADRHLPMADDEDSETVGPDIDLEKLSSDRVSSPDDAHPDEDHGAADHDHGEDHGREQGPPVLDRSTAPQSDFTTREAAIGALVTVIGAVVVFGVPFVLA